MSDKYKLVSLNGNVVPSGYTDGTLSLKETVAYLKAINRLDDIEALLNSYVETVLKNAKVEGSTISSITNIKTKKTWTAQEFSKALFAAVNKNPQNYDISYTGNVNRGFNKTVSPEAVERHTVTDTSKASILTNGSKSFLIKVDRENGSTDYFDVAGDHFPEDAAKIKNYSPIPGLEGIDSKKFAQNYDEYVSEAFKTRKREQGKSPEVRAKSIFEGVDDSMEKLGTLKYKPSDDIDAVQGELSKLFVFASSKGLENVCEKIIDFTNNMESDPEATLEITKEDLKGKITPESLDKLLTNLSDADMPEFAAYVNMVSPRGYSLIHSITEVLSDSGVGELIRRVASGEVDYRGTNDEKSATYNIRNAFSGRENLSDASTISLLASSPKVNSLLESIFYLAGRQPTKPVFSFSKAALYSLGELGEVLDTSTKKAIVKGMTGAKSMKDDIAEQAFENLVTKKSIDSLTDKEREQLADLVSENISQKMTTGLISALDKIDSKKSDGSENSSKRERLSRAMRYLSAVNAFDPSKPMEFKFSQGIDRAIMATMLSLSRADILDPAIESAYKSTLAKQEFLKGVDDKVRFSQEGKMLLALTGLRVEKDEDGKYRIFDGVFEKGLELTEKSLKGIMKKYKSANGEFVNQDSKSAWANILGESIGRHKVKTGNEDTRTSVLKYGKLVAPLIRSVPDALGFSPSDYSIEVPDDMSMDEFADSLIEKITSNDHENMSELKALNRVFSSPLIDSFIAAQAQGVAERIAPLDKANGIVKTGKHIGDLLEIGMLLSSTLGVIEHHSGRLEDMKDGELTVLHSPAEGDLTGNKISSALSTAFGVDIPFAVDFSAVGSIVRHGDKVYVSMKENRDTGAVDGEVMVFSKDKDGISLSKHQMEYKNSHNKSQTPHLNQYAPHAAVESAAASGVDSVSINNTVALNLITPSNKAEPTRVSVAHSAFSHVPDSTSSTEGHRSGTLIGETTESVPTKLTPR